MQWDPEASLELEKIDRSYLIPYTGSREREKIASRPSLQIIRTHSPHDILLPARDYHLKTL